MATLYARASANWDAANQWNTAADGSGSFQTPGASDICDANGFTVAINIDITCAKLQNSSASAGGFTLTVAAANRTINCDSIDASVSNRAAALITVTGGNNTLTINSTTGSGKAEILGGNVSGALALNFSSSCYLTLNANITGGAGTHGMYDGGGGKTSGRVINGNITGGATGTTYGFSIATATSDVLDITGIISPGTGNGPGIYTGAVSCTIRLGSGSELRNYNATGSAAAIAGSVRVVWPTTDLATQVVKYKDASGNIHTLSAFGPATADLAAAMWSNVTSPNRSLTS